MNKINLYVTSRQDAHSFVPAEKFSVISVWTPDCEPNYFISKPHNVLSLCFSDFSDPKLDGIETEFGIVQLFKPMQAKDILEFVNKEIKEGIKDFLIHCDAGISRSPGIAVALNEIYNKDNIINKNHMLFNSYVYKTIIKEYQKTL